MTTATLDKSEWVEMEHYVLTLARNAIRRFSRTRRTKLNNTYKGMSKSCKVDVPAHPILDFTIRNQWNKLD